MRQAYMAACVCLTVWSLSYAIMTLSHNLDVERISWGLGFVGCCMFFPSWLHFLVLLSGAHPPARLLRVKAYYLASAVLALLCILHSNQVTFVDTVLGTQFIYAGALFKLTFAYFTLMFFFFMSMVFVWYRDAKIKRQKRQALVFIICSVLIGPPAFFWEVYNPGFFGKPGFPIATSLIMLVSLIFFFVLRVNKGLDITVENAANIIFKTVSTPVLLLDHNDAVVVANKPAKKLFRQALDGARLSALIRVDGQEPGPAFFARDMDKTVVNIMSTEGVRVCHLRLAVSRDRYGDVQNKVVTIDDITDMQNALIRARNASQAKGDFLSRMSHEIRTPLNAIIGMTTLGLKNRDDPQQMRYSLERIDGASNNLLALINNILDISKIEADRVELHEDSFNLDKLLCDVANVVSESALRKGVEFLVHVDPDIPCRVIGDRLRLSQILTNLLSNSIKFTDEGSVQLTVDCAPADTENASNVRFEVRDTGIGIAQDKINRLFTAFMQADSSISATHGGTGLGLAISKSFVQMMGGDIRVDSEVGKGSVFSFTIRLPHAEAPPGRLDKDRSVYKNLRVLVVDDSPETLRFFDTVLSQVGVQYDLVDSGKAAVEIALERKRAGQAYDVAFVDYLMDEMDGIETCGRLRWILDHKLNIIMVSIVEWEQIRERAEKAGVSRFIHKPLFSSSIYNILTELAAGGRAAPELDLPRIWETAATFSRCRILLVEDMEINREIVKGLLEDTLVQIDSAENGKEAVHMFSNADPPYDLVFMDLQMPEMGGLEATRAIREMDGDAAREVPIVAMTANAFKEDVDECLAAGMNDHISKPIDPDTLLCLTAKYLMPKADTGAAVAEENQ